MFYSCYISAITDIIRLQYTRPSYDSEELLVTTLDKPNGEYGVQRDSGRSRSQCDDLRYLSFAAHGRAIRAEASQGAICEG